MTANTQTLTRIQSLERLYRGGYRSRVIDTTIDKLVEIEATALQRELASQEERLRAFEAQYALSSAEFYSRFRAGKMGDSADMFEWSAFYQMRASTLKRLQTLAGGVA